MVSLTNFAGKVDAIALAMSFYKSLVVASTGYGWGHGLTGLGTATHLMIQPTQKDNRQEIYYQMYILVVLCIHV